jgi:hypothetical protein
VTESLHDSLRAKVTVWGIPKQGIPNQPYNHMVDLQRIHRHDVISHRGEVLKDIAVDTLAIIIVSVLCQDFQAKSNVSVETKPMFCKVRNLTMNHYTFHELLVHLEMTRNMLFSQYCELSLTLMCCGIHKPVSIGHMALVWR